MEKNNKLMEKNLVNIQKNILEEKMKSYKLDIQEQELLDSLESEEWQSKGDLSRRTKELQSYLKNQKKKAISIRISENDLYELRKKAHENAIPYQNLIQMLIHQYATDKIKISV